MLISTVVLSFAATLGACQLVFENVFNFIDLFLYDSSVNIGEYELISYPKIMINKDEHNKMKINKQINSKNVQFMVKEKEID